MVSGLKLKPRDLPRTTQIQPRARRVRGHRDIVNSLRCDSTGYGSAGNGVLVRIDWRQPFQSPERHAGTAHAHGICLG